MKAFAAILLVALSTAAVPTASQPVRMPPPTVQEIVSLLDAGVGQGVILQMIAARGAPAAVSVADLLALRSAGAGDPLLAALAGGPEPAPALTGFRSTATGGLRTWVEVGADGARILHVSNLDADGRRIGGEISPAERARLTAESSQSDPRGSEVYRETPAASPVIVNVYTQPADDDPAGYAGWIGSYLPSGRHPGFLHHPHRGGSPRPPAAREEFFGRPRIIDTTPYRAATAAQRNRARFPRE